ncbi:AAA family ATPase [Marinomonas sp.]|uniref:AAA family ATPase n=1 Tax=Marinomonas sp. TaxID=1904862 RepID=UPI003BABEC60
MNMNLDWAQKYRPTAIQDVILPINLKERLQKVITQSGGISLLFWGRPGCGKTTVGQLINPSETYQIDCTTSRSIDMVRSLERYCSTFSLEGSRKLVLLDEADHLSKDAQNAFRGVVERFSVSTDFVMTANNPNIFSEPIRSRCFPVHFDVTSDPSMEEQFVTRVTEVLSQEGIKDFDIERVREIVKTNFPDLRRTLKQVQFELG